VERRNSTSRLGGLASEAEVDDIVGIFDAADIQSTLGSCRFDASRLDMLPKYGPEELILAAVVDKQVKMECTINSVSARIDQGHLTTVALESKLEFFNSTLTAHAGRKTNKPLQ